MSQIIYQPDGSILIEADAFVTTRSQIQAFAKQGVAPFSVYSNTFVANLNVEFLNGQPFEYYLDYNNFTNLPILTFAELGDTNITAPQNYDILYYDSNNSEWINLNVGEAGEVLTANSQGQLEWQAPAGAGLISNAGTGGANRVTYWTDASTIGGDANLTWDGSDLRVNGQLLFKAATTSPISTNIAAGIIPGLQLKSATTGNGASLLLQRTGNDATSPYLMLAKTRADNYTTNLIGGDELGRILFLSPNDDATTPALATSAEIRGIADGNHAPNDIPGTILFLTVPSGSQTLSERMRIKSDGDINILNDVKIGGLATDTPAASLEISGTTTAGGIYIEDSSVSNAAPGIEIIGKRSDGNVSQSFGGKLMLAKNYTGGSTLSGSYLGTIGFGGNHTDGTIANILYAASISGISDGNFTNSTTMPTGLAFLTGSIGRDPDTANVTAGTERMRIKSDGNINILNDVKIGGLATDTPGSELDIEGISAEIILNSTNSSYSRISHRHNGTAVWTSGTRVTDDYHIYRESGSGNIVTHSHVLPNADSTYDLGSNSLYWANTYSDRFISNYGEDNSLDDAAIWLKASYGSILLDSNGEKRISWNDGVGNFQIRAGHYSKDLGGSSWQETHVSPGNNDGAVAIKMGSDDSDGSLEFRTSIAGTNDTVVSWTNYLILDSNPNELYTNVPVFRPANDSATALGTTSEYWSGIYTDNVYTATIHGYSGSSYSTLNLKATGYTIQDETGRVNSHFAYGVDNDIYLSFGDTGSVIIRSDTGAAYTNRFTANTSGLYPAQDSTYDLGSSSGPRAWASIHGDQLRISYDGTANKYDNAIIGGSADTGQTLIGHWDSNSTDIDGLLPGSTFGTIISGASAGHMVFALRDNDITDSLAIISGGGNWSADTTYDTVIARFDADGFTNLQHTLPRADSTYDLGSDTVRWANAYINTYRPPTHSASNLAVGWYTIAVIPGTGSSGGALGRGTARFVIRETTASRHGTIVFQASHHFGRGNTITVYNASVYGGTHIITDIRIKNGTTYDGALLQVYVSNATNTLSFDIYDNLQTDGWLIKDWIADASDPGDVNFAALTNIAAKINCDNMVYGGGGYAVSDLGGTNAGEIQFISSDTSGTWIGPHIILSGNNGTNEFAFGVWDAQNSFSIFDGRTLNSGSERLRIKSDGDINILNDVKIGGLATDTPLAPLEVYNPSLGTTAGNVKELLTLRTTSSNEQYLEFFALREEDGSNWQSAGTRIQSRIDSTYQSWIEFNGTAGDHSIAFGSGSDGGATDPQAVSERMRIKSDGNINILNDVKIGGAGGDTPSAKLHVTNAGTGDSFRVDDAASDTTPFVINSAGNIIKGYTSSLGTYDHPQSETDSAPQFQIHGDVSSVAGLALTSWNTLDASYYAPVIYLAKSSSGTVGTQASGLVDGEDLGSIVWSGDDGVSFIKAAMIQAEIDGTPGVDDSPGRIKFLTSADGSATPTERMRIKSDGDINILNDVKIGGSAGDTPSAALEVVGDIFPGADSTYDLGADTLRWSETYSDRFYSDTSSTRNKYNFYGTTASYAIGMQTGITYGGLSDWGMTFQFNNDADRGFWWGDDAHTAAQGAMSLTTAGELVVAKSLSLGYGEATTSALPYGTSSKVLNVYFNDTNADETTYAAVIDANFNDNTTITVATDKTKSALFIDVDSSSTAGNTDDEHRIYALNIDVDSNGTSDAVYGAYIASRAYNSSGTASNVRGIFAIAEADPASGGTASNAHGGYFLGQHGGVGTVSAIGGSVNIAQKISAAAGSSVPTMYGAFNQAIHSDTTALVDSVITNAYASLNEVQIDAGHYQNVAITNARGVRSIIDINTDRADIITNGYLFYGDYDFPSTAGASSVTNPWGIYLTGSTDNYIEGDMVFSDAVKIGGAATDTPVSALEVNGLVTSDQLTLNTPTVSTPLITFPGTAYIGRTTTQGGLWISCDSSLVLSAGDHHYSSRSDLGIVDGTTAEHLYLTADGEVRLYSNYQNGIATANTIIMNAAGGWVPGSDSAQDLGTTSLRWANLYVDDITKTSTTLVTNLNADLLDGYHGSSYVRESIGRVDTVFSSADWNDYTATGIYTVSDWVNNAATNGPNIPNGSGNAYSWGVLKVSRFDLGGTTYILQEYWPHNSDAVFSRIYWSTWTAWAEIFSTRTSIIPAADSTYTIGNSSTYFSHVYSDQFSTNSVGDNAKFRLWNSDSYSIGFGNYYNFGGLGTSTTNEYAMAFNMNNTANRGWIFKHGVALANNVGAMALTNVGDMYLAGNLEIGGGTTANTQNTTATLYINDANQMALFADGSSTVASSLTWGAAANHLLRTENSELAIGLESTSPYNLFLQARTQASGVRDISLQPRGGDVGIKVPYNDTINAALDVRGDIRFGGEGSFIKSGDARRSMSSSYTITTLVPNTNYKIYIGRFSIGRHHLYMSNPGWGGYEQHHIEIDITYYNTAGFTAAVDPFPGATIISDSMSYGFGELKGVYGYTVAGSNNQDADIWIDYTTNSAATSNQTLYYYVDSYGFDSDPFDKPTQPTTPPFSAADRMQPALVIGAFNGTQSGAGTAGYVNILNALQVGYDTQSSSSAVDTPASALDVSGTIFVQPGDSFDPPGGGTGTDTSTTTALAFPMGYGIRGTDNGYIRNLLEWTGSALNIGATGTSYFNNGINLYSGSVGPINLGDGSGGNINVSPGDTYNFNIYPVDTDVTQGTYNGVYINPLMTATGSVTGGNKTSRGLYLNVTTSGNPTANNLSGYQLNSIGQYLVNTASANNLNSSQGMAVYNYHNGGYYSAGMVGNNSYAIYAQNNQNQQAGTISNAYGLYATNYIGNATGGGTINNAYGVRGYVRKSTISTTTTTNMFGGYFTSQTESTSAGAITNMYGVYAYCDDNGNKATNAYGLYVYLDSGTSSKYNIYTAGDTATCYIKGDIEATGNITAYSSDKRLKTNLRPISNSLEMIDKINAYKFDWDENKCKEVGFEPEQLTEYGVIAQEIEAIMPEIVRQAPFDIPHPGSEEEKERQKDTDREYYKTVKYDKLTALLIAAVKELKAEVEELKRRK